MGVGYGLTCQDFASPIPWGQALLGEGTESIQKGAGRLRTLGQVTYFAPHSLEETVSN